MSLTTTAGMALLAMSCSPSDILKVEDPDIINPSNVESAAGADAVRLGALSRFVGATSGDESLWFLGGLFTDEWNNGDSYIDRWEIDQRNTTSRNSYILGTNRVLHRVRLASKQAIELLTEYSPTGPGWKVGEMYMVQAYVLNIMAEDFCDGIILSDVVEGREVYGEPMSNNEVYELALTAANNGLAAVTGSTTDDVRVRSALAIVKGRILTNLNRHSEAAAAVAGVATSYAYTNYHSQTTYDNAFWSWHINSRRYSVSDGEGTNGLNFFSAKDPRVPTCLYPDAACKAVGVTRADRDDLTQPFDVLLLWPGRGDAINIMQGVDARMIEAEAKLKGGDAAGALAILNAARATKGMAPLADAGTADARLMQLFRERAFWQFARGYRMGDLRRLVRQYGKSQSQVYPIGPHHKGGNYGDYVDFPLPQAEENNPNLGIGNNCRSRGA